ncbi:MAG: hypothetical protein AAGJ31_03815, partial [Verrucomicrobiota bacterium]
MRESDLRALTLALLFSLLGGLLLLSPLQARLKSRTELAEEKAQRTYDERRARGMIALNEQILKSLEEAKSQFFQEGDIKGAQQVETASQLLTEESEYIRKTTRIRSGRVPREI